MCKLTQVGIKIPIRRRNFAKNPGILNAGTNLPLVADDSFLFIQCLKLFFLVGSYFGIIKIVKGFSEIFPFV